jgi:hypothetical protein
LNVSGAFNQQLVNRPGIRAMRWAGAKGCFIQWKASR